MFSFVLPICFLRLSQYKLKTQIIEILKSWYFKSIYWDKSIKLPYESLTLKFINSIWKKYMETKRVIYKKIFFIKTFFNFVFNRWNNHYLKNFENWLSTFLDANELDSHIYYFVPKKCMENYFNVFSEITIVLNVKIEWVRELY